MQPTTQQPEGWSDLRFYAPARHAPWYKRNPRPSRRRRCVRAPEVHYRIVGRFARPVALVLQQHLLRSPAPPRLHHPVNRPLMGVDRGAAGGIRHYIDLVARLQRHQRRESQADFGPQSGDHQLLRPVAFTAATNASSSPVSSWRYVQSA